MHHQNSACLLIYQNKYRLQTCGIQEKRSLASSPALPVLILTHSAGLLVGESCLQWPPWMRCLCTSSSADGSVQKWSAVFIFVYSKAQGPTVTVKVNSYIVHKHHFYVAEMCVFFRLPVYLINSQPLGFILRLLAGSHCFREQNTKTA